MILLPGLAGYILFLLFDLNKIRWHRSLGNLLFPAGSVLLGLSVVLCILSSVKDGFTLTLWGAVSLLFALISLLSTVYALFFALPANTYSHPASLRWSPPACTDCADIPPAGRLPASFSSYI